MGIWSTCGVANNINCAKGDGETASRRARLVGSEREIRRGRRSWKGPNYGRGRGTKRRGEGGSSRPAEPRELLQAVLARLPLPLLHLLDRRIERKDPLVPLNLRAYPSAPPSPSPPTKLTLLLALNTLRFPALPSRKCSAFFFQTTNVQSSSSSVVRSPSVAE